ncbi:MAG TPA: hypothetical protein VFM18_09810 [Methanosarcina sp.]|nr:hypothetical protein [Methanosarcina sp.]
MKRFFLFVFYMLFSMSAFAGITTNNLEGFNDLPEAQKAEIAQLVAQKKEETAPISSDKTLTRLDKYAEVGQRLGVGLVAAAKELGIAANDFVKTPVGKVTAALIIWKVIGNDFLHLFGAFFFFFISPPCIIFVFKRYMWEYAKEKTLTRTNFKGQTSTKTVLIYELTNDAKSLMIFLLGVSLFIGLISLFSM